MEKKYQIFISSTYKDLIEARSKVRDAILSMMHFLVGMEMFNAADEEQWEIIQETEKVLKHMKNCLLIAQIMQSKSSYIIMMENATIFMYQVELNQDTLVRVVILIISKVLKVI